MGFIAQAIEKRIGYGNEDKPFWNEVFGRRSATGVTVTATTAMSCVPYFAGVRLISETVGQLPLIEYRRILPRGKVRATDRRLYYLLHDEPNPEMNAISFWEALYGHAITWGNAFAEIQWDMGTGMPIALWPLRPDRMKVGREPDTKELVYAYQLPDGTTVKQPRYRVWHMPGFGFDGLIGYDTVSLAREAIGMALAMEEFGARFFGNGASPGGVLEHPNKLGKEALENLRNSWAEMHQGLSNQHRIAILEEGMKYQQVGIPPENAQFLESRKFQKGEIATLLHIPPHMIGDMERATFSNIEQQALEYLKYTIKPWTTRGEQTCHRKLLVASEKQIYFVEYLLDDLLQADSTARAAFYRELFYLGALSPNDIRDKENMNPIPDEGGDAYYIQQNMLPMSQAGVLPSGTGRRSGAEDFRPLFQDAVHRIADREKQNILRQAKKNPDGFTAWLPDFYRDFRSFVVTQIEPVVRVCAAEAAPLDMDAWVNERTHLLASRYIEQSRRDLEAIPLPNLEMALTNWETGRQLNVTGVC